MTRLEILNFLNEVERKIPVNLWYVGEVQLWPFVRVQLAYKLINHFEQLGTPVNTNKSRSPNNNSQPSAKSIPNFKIIKILRRYWSYLYRTRKVDFLFVGADTHRMQYKGEFINKFFYPLVQQIEKGNRSFHHLEYGLPANYPKNVSPAHSIIFVLELFHLFTELTQRGILKKNHIKNNEIHLPQYDTFETHVKSLFPSIQQVLSFIKKEEMIKRAKSWNRKVKYYQRILDKLKPAYIFELCYYDENVMSLNIAAKKKHIPTIEIMHGVPSEVHIAYSRWATIDAQGYHALPSQFWCWSENDRKIIDEWASNSITHKTFLGGHPWIDYIKETIKVENKPRNRKRILFTMQPIGELLNRQIIESIKQTGNNYDWWLRLHPRQLHRLEELVNLLKTHEISEVVNLQEATYLPLPEVLMSTDLHITKFSGATVEASLFGIKTILIDELGAVSYSHLIKSSMAFYVSTPTAESIADNIVKVLNETSEVKDNNNGFSYKSIMAKFVGS